MEISLSGLIVLAKAPSSHRIWLCAIWHDCTSADKNWHILVAWFLSKAHTAPTIYRKDFATVYGYKCLFKSMSRRLQTLTKRTFTHLLNRCSLVTITRSPSSCLSCFSDTGQQSFFSSFLRIRRNQWTTVHLTLSSMLPTFLVSVSKTKLIVGDYTFTSSWRNTLLSFGLLLTTNLRNTRRFIITTMSDLGDSNGSTSMKALHLWFWRVKAEEQKACILQTVRMIICPPWTWQIKW